jgi:hypothetical protein
MELSRHCYPIPTALKTGGRKKMLHCNKVRLFYVRDSRLDEYCLAVIEFSYSAD